VHAHGLDKYGRTVGELVTEDGRKVSEELIRAGLAWFNFRYSDQVALGKLQAAARSAHRGLWKQRRPQAPWTWRHQNR
jgi:endonuclease YncB( thermonuclease family)